MMAPGGSSLEQRHVWQDPDLPERSRLRLRPVTEVDLCEHGTVTCQPPKNARAVCQEYVEPCWSYPIGCCPASITRSLHCMSSICQSICSPGPARNPLSGPEEDRMMI